MKPKTMPVVWCSNVDPGDPTRTAQIGAACETMKVNTKPFHAHPNGQFTVAIKELVCLETEANRYVVPKRCAVWTPPGVRHYGLLGRDAQAFYFLISRAVPALPARARAPHAQLDDLRDAPLPLAPRQRDEAREPLRAHCPGRDRAARDGKAAAGGLRADPGRPAAALAVDMCSPDNYALDNKAWAGRLNKSERTLSRRILHETGLSFRLWRQHIRFLPALTLIAQGRSVEEVADKMHYETSSAFIIAFRRVFGMTPGALRRGF